MKHFKELTSGHPVIMGRKTYESIGRPLPGRTNIIVTRDSTFRADRCIVVHSLDEAIDEANKLGSDEVFVIGGGQIYETAIKKADKLYLTIVEGQYEADTFFPDYSEFKHVVLEQKHKEGSYEFTFLELTKK